MALIEIDYQQAMSQVSQLQDLSDRVSQIANDKVGEALDGLDASWDGKTSDVFLKKGRKLEANFQSLAKKIDNTAESMSRTAKRLYDLDQMMKSISVSSFIGKLFYTSL